MSEINETIRLASAVAEQLASYSETHFANGSVELAARYEKQAAAIRELVALHTPKDRPTCKGLWVRIEKPDDPDFLMKVIDTNRHPFYITDKRVFGTWYGPFHFAAKQQEER